MESSLPSYDYGHWSFVVINILIFLFFVLSYFRPRTSLDWRASGSFMAFVIALFTEMYGLPLSLYFLSGWLSSQFPGIDLYAHATGRFWHLWLDTYWPPYLNPFFIVSNILIWGSVILLAKSWGVLYRAQKEKRVARTGPYAYLRHPQYLCFFLIMLGFLVQWPTLPTLILFPILTLTYAKLARREEQDSLKNFGEAYRSYQKEVPAFNFIEGWRRMRLTPKEMVHSSRA